MYLSQLPFSYFLPIMLRPSQRFAGDGRFDFLASDFFRLLSCVTVNHLILDAYMTWIRESRTISGSDSYKQFIISLYIFYIQFVVSFTCWSNLHKTI